MTNKLQLKAIALHTEHAFVLNEFLSLDKEDSYDSLIDALNSMTFHGCLDFFHMNHFVIECENGIFIGCNDGYIKVGTYMTKLEDSETQKVSFKLFIPV